MRLTHCNSYKDFRYIRRKRGYRMITLKSPMVHSIACEWGVFISAKAWHASMQEEVKYWFSVHIRRHWRATAEMAEKQLRKISPDEKVGRPWSHQPRRFRCLWRMIGRAPASSGKVCYIFNLISYCLWQTKEANFLVSLWVPTAPVGPTTCFYGTI